MHATTEHIIYTHSAEEIVQIKNDLEKALNTIPKYKFRKKEIKLLHLCYMNKDVNNYSNHERQLIGNIAIHYGLHRISEDDQITDIVKKLPEFGKRVSEVLQNPEPTLVYKQDIYPLRIIFCNALGIDVGTLKSITNYRKIFIAIVVRLYYPAFITGYRSDIMDGLAHELSGALDCHREWISKHHDYIRDVLSDDWKMARTYEADRKTIDELTELMGNEILKERSSNKICREIEMFSNTANDVIQ